MGIEQRPYIGTWRLNNRQLVQYTPDCLVYINGDLTVPGSNLRGEQSRLNLQPYITSVSVEGSVEPGGHSANVSVSLPVHLLESVVRDAQFILRPALEVHVYMRGYFPVRGLFRETGDDVEVYDSETGQFAAGEPDVTFEEFEGEGDTEQVDGEGVETPTSTLNLEDTIANSCLSPAQQQVANTIAQTIRNAGYSDNLALAAITNGIQESSLNPNAVQQTTWTDSSGDERQPTGALGIFQLLPDKGAGAGVAGFENGKAAGTSETESTYDAFDVDTNTRRMIWEMQNTKFGESIRQAEAEGASAAVLTDLWSHDLERSQSSDSRVPIGVECFGEDAMGATGGSFETFNTLNVDEALSGSNEFEGRGWHSKQVWDDLLSYPYYHVFHGVVTDVSFSYSGGFQTAQMNCASMLHFWQYHKVSTSAAARGVKVANSGLKTSYTGNWYTNKTPYEIIYSLWHDTAGSAAGLSSTFSQKTNIAASYQGASLFSIAIEYWRRRFQTQMNNLRLHGISGQLFNSAQAAFLGRLSKDEAKALFPSEGGAHQGSTNILSAAQALNLLDPRKTATNEKAAAEQEQTGTAGEGQTGLFEEGDQVELNIFSMLPFVYDIGSLGAPALFESAFMSKLDIAQQVCEATNFEFFQDMDGDFVFKPHMYNMDTSSSRVYRIEDIDLIDINFSEKEPIATYVTAKGNTFENVQGTGTEGEWGASGLYVDYRLVAQFGWRPGDMEISYYNDARRMFYAAINKLDLLNIEMSSGSCNIPLRPEMRPGYPVYIPYLDAFYYVPSFSHSYQVGGRCTTSLQLTGKRAKFFAPGDTADMNGGLDTIHLENLAYPPKPLQVLDDENNARMVGFPNVVMALDPQGVNPLELIAGADFTDLTDTQSLRALLYYAVQMRNEITGPDSQGYYQYQGDLFGGKKVSLYISDPEQERGSGVYQEGQAIDLRAVGEVSTEIDKANLQQGIQTVDTATVTGPDDQQISASTEAINFLQELAEWGENWLSGSALSGWENPNSSANYLSLLANQKSRYTCDQIPGFFRYYSQAHPDEEHQGVAFDFDDTGAVVEDGSKASTGDLPTGGEVFLRDTVSPEAGIIAPETALEFQDGAVKRGIYVKDAYGDLQAVPTGAIQNISFMRHTETRWQEVTVPAVVRKRRPTKNRIQNNVWNNWRGLIATKYTRNLSEYMDTAVGTFVTDNLLPPLNTLKNGGTTTATPGGVPNFAMPSSYFPYGQQATSQDTFEDIAVRYNIDTSGGNDLKHFRTVLEAVARSMVAAFWQGYQDTINGAVVAVDVVEAQMTHLVPQPKPKQQSKTEMQKKTVEGYSPVFPVSDEKGYTVIGAYRYGRGVDIVANNPFDQLLKTDPLSAIDRETVEAYVDTVIKGAQTATITKTDADGDPMNEGGSPVSTTVEVNAADAHNNMMEAITGTLSSQQILDLGLGKMSGGQLEVNLMNWFADQVRDGTQKIPIENSAYSLADLGFSKDTLPYASEYRGAEADVSLPAFSTDFVDIAAQQDIGKAEAYADLEFDPSSGEPILDIPSVYQTLEQGSKTPDWRQSQSALRGLALENRQPSTAQEFQAVIDRFDDSVRNSFQQLKDETLTQDAERAAQQAASTTEET